MKHLTAVISRLKPRSQAMLRLNREAVLDDLRVIESELAEITNFAASGPRQSRVNRSYRTVCDLIAALEGAAS